MLRLHAKGRIALDIHALHAAVVDKIVHISAAERIAEQAVDHIRFDLVGHGLVVVDIHHQLRARILIVGAHIAQISVVLRERYKVVFSGHQRLVARAVHVFNHKAHAAGGAEAAHHRRQAHENARIGAGAEEAAGARFQGGCALFGTRPLIPRLEPHGEPPEALVAADAGNRRHSGHFRLLGKIIAQFADGGLQALIGGAGRHGHAHREKALVFFGQKRSGQPGKQHGAHRQQRNKRRQHDFAAAQ